MIQTLTLNDKEQIKSQTELHLKITIVQKDYRRNFLHIFYFHCSRFVFNLKLANVFFKEKLWFNVVCFRYKDGNLRI